MSTSVEQIGKKAPTDGGPPEDIVARVVTVPVLLHNVGEVVPTREFAQAVQPLPEDDWDALFAVNVKGAFLLGKHAIPHMRDTGGGSFIITASANSFYAESDIAGYCATKGAAMQLTRAMAIDHGPEGVRVNCICPGWIETAMSLPFLDENPDGRAFAGRIAPSGRIGQPEDVAEVALFLASDESRFVTGAAYNVDGGWTAGMTKAVALV